MERSSARSSCGKVAGGTVAKVQEPRERKADGRKAAAASDVPAKAIAAAGKTPSASDKPRWTSIGICCTLAWAFLINAAGGEAPLDERVPAGYAGLLR